MTSNEFGVVSRIAAILFFGFLIPSSTGNEFFVLQQESLRVRNTEQTAGSHSAESRTANALDVFINMPLEERLESCTRFYSAGEFGEMDCCTDALRDKAFCSFLQNGLGPLLAGRPAHPTETHVLHLIAMSISPQPQYNLMQDTANALDERGGASWALAKRLMNCVHSNSFQVNYSHRVLLVKMMAEQLVLPEREPDVISLGGGGDMLMNSAVPHLRAALHTFAVGAQSIEHSHWAERALVNIAVRTGVEVLVNEEWDSLVNRTVKDGSDCDCSRRKASNSSNEFCVHSARGELMKEFILKYSQSRHYDDSVFTGRALVSLSACIETQVQDLTAAAESKEVPASAPISSCRLASLLSAARSLFYFLLPEAAVPDDDTLKGDDTLDDEIKSSRSPSERKHANDLLLRNAVQLLHHPHVNVAREASSLLALAFAYSPKDVPAAYARGTQDSIQMALEKVFPTNGPFDSETIALHLQALESVVIALSRLSTVFASDMLMYILGKIRSDSVSGNHSNVAASRLIVVTATAQPVAAQKHREPIIAMAKTVQSDIGKSHLVAALLATRHSHYFAKDTKKETQVAVNELTSTISDAWIKYKLARHAMATGNFNIASALFHSVIASSASEASYLWASVLSNVAQAEEALAEKGSEGILVATPLLHSGLSYLESLAVPSGKSIASSQNFGFQIEFLRLRIDFLDLCAALRNISREIRLSGLVPKANVRTGLHLRNILKSFGSLAGRYFSCHERNGLFLCQQSRSAIRTSYALCEWLRDAGRKIFPEVLTAKMEKERGSSSTSPHGDLSHPLTVMLRKLKSVVLDPTEHGSLDPQLRGAAMVEVLDAILMTAYPFPRGFTVVKSVPTASLRLSRDASTVETDDPASPDDAADGAEAEEAIVNVYPGNTFTIVASGKLSPSTTQMADIPFSRALCWHKVRYLGPLNPDDEVNSETKATSRVDGQAALAPPFDGHPQFVCPLLPCEQVLAHIRCHAPAIEGIYEVQVKLGCRDVRCGEWDLPVDGGTRSITVRVCNQARNYDER